MMTEMSVLRGNESSNADVTAPNAPSYQPLSFAEDSIFAGLSFPQVPMTTPARAQPVDVSSIPSAPSHLPAGYSPAMHTPATPTAPPSTQTIDYHENNTFLEDEQINETTSLLENSTTVSVPVEASQQRRKASNLSSLYATPIPTENMPRAVPIVSDNSSSARYPELPTMVRREVVMGTAAISTTSNNNTNLNTNSSVAGVLQPTTSNIETTSGTTLVNELLHENSRLSDEVTRLRLILEQQQQPPQGQPAQHLPSITQQAPTYSPMIHQQQAIIPQSNMIVSSQLPLHTAAAQQRQAPPIPPNSNTAITATLYNQNPALAANPTMGVQQQREGVKYVCCGGCQQWLVAPRTAVYVVCSRCESVNNCNIATAPPGTVPNDQARQIETNALTYHREQGPWYLDCFRQFF